MARAGRWFYSRRGGTIGNRSRDTLRTSPLSRLSGAARGLSARLLALTVLFVLLGEVFIYVPSIARYRLIFLEERIEAARLAALAVEAAPDQAVADALGAALPARADIVAAVVERPDGRKTILGGGMATEPDAHFDLREATFLSLIGHAFDTLRHGGARTIRVVGTAAGEPPGTLVDIRLPEASLHAAMIDYSGRILALSLVLAFIVAGLVYLSLHWLMIRPLGRMTDSLISFRRAPEDAAATIAVSGRRDEIGLAQRELHVMQRRVRAALRQKARLAAVGAGVAKINHDLRNMLATAALLSDRLADARDPDVRKLAAPMVSAIDRAAALCTQTLTYATAGVPEPRRSSFALAPLVDEVESALPIAAGGTIVWCNDVPPGLRVSADRDQAYRVVTNLARNAVEALAGRAEGGTVRIGARREAADTIVEIADTGPGLPDEARNHLFEAFSGAGKSDGTGLGLAIARDLMHNHGGAISLDRSGPTGTVFSLRFPDPPAGEEAKPYRA